MRSALRRILDEDWIVVLACGIALGYTGILTVGGHVISFGPLVSDALAFLVVVLAVALVVSRLPRKAD